ncbi:Response regulator GacA [Flavobacterium bizetiae]|uniref:Response regulator GacA n=1 Tax=Flavobacterium bizetiae TaxID=2704140 RepID=A0A6J4GNA1_9FLAO|nr:response regulator transcription factor [Flavobacterium bizetiae]CAA9199696.1 Response regulator GacA [Flavobacterium bizetiae]CAD5341422.1 Response regulator GacA [Flavobacterium bizetiae]CAD5347889.1 Response regulator GacA [Flavobacterium bizetiae]
MKKQYNILLADDHSVVRHGVSLILKDAFQRINITHCDSFDQVISKLREKQDLIFLDINLPGGNSTKMIEKIRQNYPNLLILMFSAYDETQYALRYIHAGANGYLNKDSSDVEIVKAVRSIIETGKYISDAVKEKILENALYKTPINPLESLSDREIEVAELLVSGEGNLEISNKLNIQMTTVSTFKNRIFEKLGINNVVRLVEILKIYKN